MTLADLTSETGSLSHASPARLRWRAYLAERFPVIKHGVLIVSFYSSNQFLTHALASPGGPMTYDTGSLLGAATLFLFFLHLRLFDDLKDYQDDCRNYPERVLQRGVVTPGELRRAAVVLLAIECGLSLLWGWGATTAVVLAQAFSLLMRREFFLGAWLKRRFLLYASTHMLIVPLLSLMVYSFASRRPPWTAPAWFLLYAAVSFFVGFNLEISRKIRAPEEERDGVDSYTKLFGVYGAANMVLLVRAIDTGLATLIGIHLGFSWLYYAALGALFAFCLIGYFQYRWRTSPKTARRMEAYAGVYIVAFDLALIMELARMHGVRWGGGTL